MSYFRAQRTIEQVYHRRPSVQPKWGIVEQQDWRTWNDTIRNNPPSSSPSSQTKIFPVERLSRSLATNLLLIRGNIRSRTASRTTWASWASRISVITSKCKIQNGSRNNYEVKDVWRRPQSLRWWDTLSKLLYKSFGWDFRPHNQFIGPSQVNFGNFTDAWRSKQLEMAWYISIQKMLILRCGKHSKGVFSQSIFQTDFRNGPLLQSYGLKKAPNKGSRFRLWLENHSYYQHSFSLYLLRKPGFDSHQ